MGSGSKMVRTASVFRYGSTVGEQLQALSIRSGKSFSAGLRFRPQSLRISFSDLKQKVCINDAAGFISCVLPPSPMPRNAPFIY